MALKFIPFFFLLTFFFIQIHARDSHFFSKVSPATTTTTVNPTTTTTKDEENLNKQEQEPNFMQETKNPYGLYGQENTNNEFPTTTKLGNAEYRSTTNTPYNAQTQYRNQEAFNPNPNYNNDNNNNYYNNNDQFYNNNNNNDQFYNNNNNNDQFYNNNNGYDQQQNFEQTSLKENSYNTKANPTYDNNKNTNYYNGGNGYNNNERQGMSDTRFMENGKYYYDVQSENNNYKYNTNQYQSSRPNNYGTSAYYNTNSNSNINNNNNNNNYYNNENNENDENYEFNKTMENFENEFQEDEQNNNLP